MGKSMVSCRFSLKPIQSYLYNLYMDLILDTVYLSDYIVPGISRIGLANLKLLRENNNSPSTTKDVWASCFFFRFVQTCEGLTQHQTEGIPLDGNLVGFKAMCYGWSSGVQEDYIIHTIIYIYIYTVYILDSKVRVLYNHQQLTIWMCLKNKVLKNPLLHHWFLYKCGKPAINLP